MSTEGIDRLTLLERRTIEAQIVGPIVRAFAAEFGRERTLEILSRVITELAREGGATLARQVGKASLDAFATCTERWGEGGAIEVRTLRHDAEHLDFDVTRCRFAEMYRRLGLEDLGPILSCRRDFALVEGFNPSIALARTQTIMEGATHCDFRFRTGAQPETPGAGSEGRGGQGAESGTGGPRPAEATDGEPDQVG